jgi:hypothetical protein
MSETPTAELIQALCEKAGVAYDAEQNTIFVPAAKELAMLVRDIFLTTRTTSLTQPIPPPQNDNRHPTIALEPGNGAPAASPAVLPTEAPGAPNTEIERMTARNLYLERRLALIRKATEGDIEGIQALMNSWTMEDIQRKHG